MRSPSDASTPLGRVPLLRELFARVPMLEQFVMFGLVGVINTLLNFVVFTILTKGFDVWYVAASGIGFAVGACNGFVVNHRWTFRGHQGGALAGVRWAVVQGCGLGADLGIIYLCVHDGHLPELAGQAVAIAFVTTATFFANRRWTFRMHLAGDRDAAALEASPPRARAIVRPAPAVEHEREPARL
jgi:putative flippase GtrA